MSHCQSSLGFTIDLYSHMHMIMPMINSILQITISCLLNLLIKHPKSCEQANRFNRVSSSSCRIPIQLGAGLTIVADRDVVENLADHVSWYGYHVNWHYPVETTSYFRQSRRTD